MVVYTITSCAAGVINCPASWEKEIVVTKTVDAFTTVCPIEAEVTSPSSVEDAFESPPTAVPVHAAAVHIVTEVIILESCATPVVETFSPPASVSPPATHALTAVYAEPPAPVEVEKPRGNLTVAYSASSKPTSSGDAGDTVKVLRPTARAGAGKAAKALGYGGSLTVCAVTLWNALVQF
jgi:hypothetical protein